MDTQQHRTVVALTNKESLNTPYSDDHFMNLLRFCDDISEELRISFNNIYKRLDEKQNNDELH